MDLSENKNTAAGFSRNAVNQRTTSHEQPMHIPSVTLVTTETDGISSTKIEPTGKDEPPSQKELEQDVTATNPSVDSMESRG